MASYLEELTIRLAVGVSRLPEEVRARHARFFLAGQREDGGFAGREGGSDLYYTNFALRSLALLGELHGDVAERARRFLAARLAGQATIVDFLSLVYSASLLTLSAGLDVFADAAPDWREAVAAALEKLRRDDGGYAKGPEGTASSTYHTFLVALCRQLIDAPLVEPERMVAFVLSQRREDGGFVEIKPMKRSGTNPTAAAVGLLKIVGRLDDEVREGVVDFLAEMQTDEGGIRANTRIPIADLLSTFTGLLTLVDLGAADCVDARAAARYAESLEQESGGFLGAVWDQGVDVEYSFYGLATLGLLAAES
ncbi:MAG: beta-hydroxylase [Planctomycetota bacterium]|nr:MAG: beta-hydroxylase [Planctomycetota bacterium]